MFHRTLSSAYSTFLSAIICLFALPHFTAAQIGGNDRDFAFGMLDMTKDAIKKNYYDPTFHGVDIDFVFEQARERIKAAPSRDALMITIASAVLAFDDSHTTFVPPARAAEVEYGWQVAMVGDDCYITRIKPKSDAEAKGLKVGDKLLAIDGFKPTRKNLWQMYYRYFSIAPTARVNMTLLSPGDEKPHNLTIETKINKSAGLVTLQTLYERGVVRHGWFDSSKLNEYEQFGNELLIWKMHTFSTSEQSVDAAMGKARDCKTLVLDLRENGGGYVDTMKRLLGYFFDKDVKIGDQKMRKETKPMIAKTHGSGIFKGKLIVLVNHDSASASEIFAKVIQNESRGKVIGDTTMGAVMESKFFDLDSGFGKNLYFGTSVTVADLIMPDGKSLEKIGVTPDEIVLPTGKDLAESKDPVLAYASKLAGVELSPEKAGTFFPYEWPK
jgi:C-terminal peptidase prc